MMPAFYRPPLMLPLRWQDEQSGTLVAAVQAFFGHQEDRTSELTLEQFRLVRHYLAYYIHAPCWEAATQGDEENLQTLEDLRSRVGQCKSSQQLADWILECLEIGIDPL